MKKLTATILAIIISGAAVSAQKPSYFLKTASPAEIRAEVQRVMELVKPRGSFIFACTDYLCEGTPDENIYALAEAAKEFGAY